MFNNRQCRQSHWATQQLARQHKNQTKHSHLVRHFILLKQLPLMSVIVVCLDAGVGPYSSVTLLTTPCHDMFVYFSGYCLLLQCDTRTPLTSFCQSKTQTCPTSGWDENTFLMLSWGHFLPFNSKKTMNSMLFLTAKQDGKKGFHVCIILCLFVVFASNQGHYTHYSMQIYRIAFPQINVFFCWWWKCTNLYLYLTMSFSAFSVSRMPC